MKGYKVFCPDWTCRGYQFEVGKIFEEDDVKPECCDRGFHFCTKASDCFNYYNFDARNKVAEVEAIGDIDTHSDDSKCSTNKLHIIREITWQEVLELVNLGKGCTGLCNTGNWNSGDRNTGDRNSGDRNTGDRNTGYSNTGYSNTGDRNSGDWNTGDRNSGDWNTGNWNTGDSNTGNRNTGYRNSGDWNTGNWNTGYRNTGDWNTGYRNSGDWNTGNWNTGNRNTGDRNSGNRNTGDRNSGDRNTGDRNSGDRNTGNWNSGDWNTGSCNTGCFNTESQKLKFFDKETDMTFDQWWNSDARRLLNQIDFRPTDWIRSDDMTEEEKAAHPEHETTGGYLKIRDNTDCCTEWWNGLSERDREVIRNMPNFDAEKFFKITGIR